MIGIMADYPKTGCCLVSHDRVRREGGKPPFPRRIRRVNRMGRERRISLYYVASPIRL
jgi:hypothetical protein